MGENMISKEDAYRRIQDGFESDINYLWKNCDHYAGTDKIKAECMKKFTDPIDYMDAIKIFKKVFNKVHKYYHDVKYW